MYSEFHILAHKSTGHTSHFEKKACKMEVGVVYMSLKIT